MILDQILGIYDRLSETEKKVASYVLEKPDDVIHYSITEFSKIVQVSEASIFRFVRKLGFEGYQDFKIELTKQISGTRVSEEYSESEILNEYIAEIKLLVEKLGRTLDEQALNKVSDLIISSRKVIFFGVGLSSVAAEYGSLLLSVLGIPAFCYNDPHMQVTIATGLNEHDLVISVSHSGNIRDTVKSTQVARDVGAKTVAITAGINSPLSKVAEITLYSPVARFEKYEFLRGNLGELAVVEIVFRMVLNKIFASKKKHLEELSRVLKPKRYEGEEK